MKKVKMYISFLLFLLLTSIQVKAACSPKAQDIPVYKQGAHLGTRTTEPSVTASLEQNQLTVKASKGQLLDCIEYINEVLRPKAQFNLFCSDNCLEEHLGEGKDCDKHFYGGNCVMLKQLAFVLPDGKVSACEQLYWHPQFIIGDLKKQSIEEIWNSPKAWELYNLSQGVFRKESVCSHCKIFDFCNLENHRRCFVKVIKAYGKDKWDYPDPRCQYAPKVTSDLLY